MDWMSNLFIILLLTSMTGAVFYIVGLGFRLVWFRWDARLVRLQLQATQGAFVVPFVYVVLDLRLKMRMSRMTAGSRLNLFYSTPAMRQVWAGLGLVWLLLFLVLLIRKVCIRYHWMRVFQGNIPEEDVETEAMFSEICEKLGVGGKVTLCRNDLIKMPCITYSHGFTVVLPLERYTRKETAVILYHELCHYLNGDIYLKTASCIISLLHVVNPIVHIMLKRLSLACEEYCDRMACEKGRGVFSGKEYFDTVLGSLSEGRKRERYDLFLLADTTGDCERRVRSMREYRKRGSLKKRTVAVLSVCFLMGSSITALAAGEGMTEAYGDAVEATDIRMEEGEGVADITESAVALSDEEILEELARAYDLDPEDIIIMGDEGIEVYGNAIYVEWDVPAGKTCMTTNFSEEIGNVVPVTTVGDPSDIRYQMGLKDPNDLMRYVEGTGTLQHNFSITVKGGHCFFVTNLDSSRTLYVRGTVMK